MTILFAAYLGLTNAGSPNIKVTSLNYDIVAPIIYLNDLYLTNAGKQYVFLP